MDGAKFVRENLELAKEQDRAINIGIARVIAIACLGTALCVGADKYCKDEEFQKKVDDISGKILNAYLQQHG